MDLIELLGTPLQLWIITMNNPETGRGWPYPEPAARSSFAFYKAMFAAMTPRHSL